MSLFIYSLRMTYLEKVIKQFGGETETARIFKPPVTKWAVRKWRLAGKLPRTEATGETTYALQMARADPSIDASKLIATTIKKRCF